MVNNRGIRDIYYVRELNTSLIKPLRGGLWYSNWAIRPPWLNYYQYIGGIQKHFILMVELIVMYDSGYNIQLHPCYPYWKCY